MKRAWFAVVGRVLFLALILPLRSENVNPSFFTVDVSATAVLSPPSLILQWSQDTNATSYAISRKSLSETQWTLIKTLPGTAARFTDTNVLVGTAYEYQVLKSSSSPYTGSGYLAGAIALPPNERRGSLILLIDSTWKIPLAPELQRFQEDLVGDGWFVSTRYVPPSAAVSDIKSLIQTLYQLSPATTQALILFGHIPVPYSGNYNPDSHENHVGAWPADTFYADIDGVWTDSTVNNSNAEKPWNHNTPGDGKFDQSEIPSDLELQVGRIDLSNLTCFSNKTPPRDELTLLRQYLNKDHAFRQAQLALPRRGIISYNFEDDSEGLRSTPLRNYSPLFGSAPSLTVSWGEFFPTLNTSPFLFAYGAGGGSYYTCAGVGSSDDFAVNDVEAIFTLFFGSYFGDWDNESNFLRAALGSSSFTLATAWAGRPHWFFHHMAIGETIGYSARLTQNNGTNGPYQPCNVGSRGVHVALLGDPTLRLHPVLPPSNLRVSPVQTGFSLSWQASEDSNVVGYFVYRGPTSSGPFSRISGADPVQDTFFADPDGLPSSVYMVRSLKLETSGSGSYYNLSQGTFGRPYPLPSPPSIFEAAASPTAVSLTWHDNSTNESGFNLYRASEPSATFEKIATFDPNISSWQDTNIFSNAAYIYHLAAFNLAGEAAAPDEPSTIIPPRATASFVAFDTQNQGAWQGSYGLEGYNIVQDSVTYPSYLNITAFGQKTWVWNDDTTDSAALQRASTASRLAACWYSFSPFEIRFSFLDAPPHRVSLYFLDWDTAGRVQRLDWIDSDTGSLLTSHSLSNFPNGIYATFDLKGNITARLTPIAGNAVLSGIFFDSALPTAAAPVLNPGEDTFTNSVEVTLTSATSGAEIRYTTDGTLPAPSSRLYTSALTFTNTTTLKVRAFKSGMNPSTVSAAKYTIIQPAGPPVAAVIFNGSNSVRQGSWKDAVGSQGYSIFEDSQLLPSYVSVATSGKSNWIWEYATEDLRALQRKTDTSRMASCWYSSGSFDVTFNFHDNQPHRLSLYCIDWDFGGREQTVEIIDLATGQTLHTATLSEFTGGVWLDYTITNTVIVRFTRLHSYNAVLSGFFLDPPP